MKTNKRLLLVCIAIPLLVGAIAGLLTGNSREVFAMVEKPAFAPPAWVFPVVWMILYTLMGISSYLILSSDAQESAKESAIRLYGLQLWVNFLWPTFFFNLGWYGFSFFWILILWVLVVVMLVWFWDINRLAALINIPYLVWLTFAVYLNWGIWVLNR